MPTFPAVFNLSSLDGTNGFQINGRANDDTAGNSVASAGDVNGDGFDDLIIGASGADSYSQSNAGSAYVIFGKQGGFGAEVNLSALDGTNGFRLNTDHVGGYAGFSVASAGDVNGDGFDDVLVGTPGANSERGFTFVVYGKAGGFAANLYLRGLNGTTGSVIEGQGDPFGARTGHSVASAGDVNGDGFDDFIIGAPLLNRGNAYNASSRDFGASFVVFGASGGLGATPSLANLTGANGFRINGEAIGDQAGRSVASAGDVNGDGYDDLIIGAPYADPYGVDSGAAYVVFGKSAGFGANLNLSSLDGTNGFQIDGAVTRGRFGASVASAGDVNGDGFDDLVIGAANEAPNGTYSGAAYVIFGASGGFAANLALSDLDGTNGFHINGVTAGEKLGFSVASAGDVNGDGLDDLIIGAPDAEANGVLTAGSSYVVFGKTGGFSATFDLATLDGTNGFKINGEGIDDFSGRVVSSAGDINNDGFDDLIIGAPLADAGGRSNAGASYVIYGHATGSISRAGTATNDRMIGGEFNDSLLGNAGNDTLIGGAGNDTLVGGLGFDIASFAAATGNLTLSLANSGPQVAADLGTDILLGIEGLEGGSGNDSLTGDGFANLLLGGAGNDTLIGGAGDDVLAGGVGNDRLDGGAGFDVASYAAATTGLAITLVATGAVTVAGFGTDSISGIEGLEGGSGNDSLTGDAAGNLLLGGAGNDRLDGAAGNDTIFGGAGNDTIIGGTGLDFVSYATATGDLTLSLAGAATLTVAGFGTDSLSGVDGLEGGSGNDALTGDGLANLLLGGAGNDTLNGGAGADTLNGGAGTDLVSYADAGAGVTVNLLLATAQAAGGAAGDVLLQIENLTGSTYNDVLTGSALANRIDGGAGNDTITGGAGADDLQGGAGDDLFVIGSFADYASGEVIFGDAGTDELRFTGTVAGTLILGAGVDVERVVIGTGTAAAAVTTGTATINVDGSALTQSVAIIGNAGGNFLTGGAGHDTLDGGAGNDTLVGGAGDDSLAGGAGLDVASYAAATDDLVMDLFSDWLTATGFGQDSFSGIEGLEGGSGNDNLSGDQLANLLIGGAGDDTLSGGAGNDTLIGGAGADSLLGGDGNDLFLLDTTADHAAGEVVSGDAGIDELRYTGASAGTLVLTSGVAVERVVIGTGTAAVAVTTGTAAINIDGSALTGAVTMAGNSGANRLTGGAGADSLSGGLGDDILEGGAGNDTLAGGTGFDIASYSLANADLTIGLVATGAVTVAGFGVDSFAGIEGLEGGAGNDSLRGDGLANMLLGGAGNDTVDGGAGNDTLAGGAGDDTIIGGALGVDVASYGTATDDLVITLGAANTTTVLALAGFGNDSLSGIEGLEGGSGNDSLTGNEGANLLLGGAGDDTLVGGAVNDTLIGGAGTDTASYAEEGAATAGVTVNLSLATAQATGGAGSDVLSGIENLTGSAYNDVLTGSTEANLIDGGAGNDTITGGAGADTLVGGDGNDLFVISATTDHTAGETITGGAGTDELRFTGTTAGTLILGAGVDVERVVIGTGTAANAVTTGTTAINVDGSALAQSVVMIGNAGGNRLTGGAGIDSIDGGAGNDTLLGGAEEDTLIGGLGMDSLTGGSGSDTFVFNTAPNATTNRDTITDFTSVGDVLAFARSVFTGLGPAGALSADAFQSGAFTTAQDATDRLIYNTTTGALYYDADGTGGTAAIQIAQLTGGATLLVSDVLVF